MIGLEQLKGEIDKEGEDILAFWMSTSLDKNQGGFIGKLDHHGVLDPNAPKGLVLNARILWTFASAQNTNVNQKVKDIAHRAYVALNRDFLDKIHGGYFWSLTHQNEPLNLRKQIYGQAFVIYAFAAYHKYAQDPEALENALDLYRLMAKHAFDPVHGGYREAFAADWSHLEDMRLSPKDLNTPKSLNTHLHIMEAYVQLYQVWHDSGLVKKIKDLIDIFLLHFIDRKAGHVHMFFDDDWQVIPAPWSYGHDIETSWLLYEAAEHVQYRLDEVRDVAILLAEGVMPVVDAEGGVSYESHLNQKHWWVQAEAMVGFMNAYQMTSHEKYLDAVYRIWDYTKKYIKDTENGEWFWGRNEDGTVMEQEDKVGFWKCPYHNVRACMQMSERLKTIINQ
jgi:mannobiose 2-epimerase